MNRSTWLGRLFRTDRMKAREEFLRILRRYDGNVQKAAIDIGRTRRDMFRLLWREALWHELDAIRAEARRRVADAPQEMTFLERTQFALHAPSTEDAMAYRTNSVGLLVRLDPKKAVRLIEAAYRDAGSEAGAARRLGCGRTSLQRWVRALVEGGFMEAAPVARMPGRDARNRFAKADAA